MSKLFFHCNFATICERHPVTNSRVLNRHFACDDDTAEHFPRHVGFILGNEFCERFSFYGMRTILAMYARTLAPLHIVTSSAGTFGLLVSPKTGPRA